PDSQIASPALCGGRVDEVHRIWPYSPIYQHRVAIVAAAGEPLAGTTTSASGRSYWPLSPVACSGAGAGAPGVPSMTSTPTTRGDSSRSRRTTIRSRLGEGVGLSAIVSGISVGTDHRWPRSSPMRPDLTVGCPPTMYTGLGSLGVP